MAEKITFEVLLDNGKLKVQTKDAKEKIKDVGDGAEAAGETGAKGLSKITNGFKAMGAAIKGTAILAVIMAIYKLGKTALTASAEMQKHRVAFETMLGSATKAKKLLEDIKKFSASTPFQLPGLIQTSKRLLAFGVAEDQIIQKMTNLGNIAQGNSEVLDRVALAYGKISARGKASMEELNQLLEAGVPILDELSKQFGVSKQELFKLVEGGKVGFKEVDQAITNLTTGSGRFAGMLEKQSRTLGGLFSTMKDQFYLIALEIGDKLSPAFIQLISVISKAASQGGYMAKVFGLIVWPIIKIVQTVSLLVSSLNLFFKALSSGWANAKKSLNDYYIRQNEERLKEERAGKNRANVISSIEKELTRLGGKEKVLNDENLKKSEELNDIKKETIEIGKDLLGIERKINEEIAKGPEGGRPATPGAPTSPGGKKKKGKAKQSFGAKHGFTMDFYKGKDPLDLGNAHLTTLGSTLSKAGEMWNEYYSQQAAKVDSDLENKLLKNEEWYLAEKDLLLNSQMDAEARELALAQLETEKEKKDKLAKDKAEKDKKKIEREAFKKTQAIGIANVWIAAAQGVMQGFAQLGPIGGAIMAGVTLAMAGVQTALIASQKPPAMATGTANVPSDMLAQIHEGEGVIPKPFMDSVNAGELSIGAGTGTTYNVQVEGSVITENELFEKLDIMRNNRAQELGQRNYGAR